MMCFVIPGQASDSCAMTTDSQPKADLLADYRELLRIVKQRPPGILTQPETNKLIGCLEKGIAEVEIGTAGISKGPN
jgi:hypothetical protein